MASLTTHRDLVQIEFYALMRGDLVPSLSAPDDWYQRMRAITLATSPLANYRYYVDQGTSHTVLASDEEFYGRDAHAVWSVYTCFLQTSIPSEIEKSD